MSRRLGSMAVFVLVLVGIAAIEEASSTTFPGANGRIAFVYNPDGTPRIATVSPTGKDLRILVGNPSGSSDAFGRPRWSPDGGSVLVLRDTTDPPHLLLVQGDGTGSSNLGAFTGTSPSWHPDGSAIVYANEGDVFVADLTALDNPTLLIQDGTEPVWSPDGSKIAFTRSDQDFVRHIWLADGAGGNLRQLTSAVKQNLSGQSHLAWSPDSTTIAYQSGSSGRPPCKSGSSTRQAHLSNRSSPPLEGTPTRCGLPTVRRSDSGAPAEQGSGRWTRRSDQIRASTWAGSGFDWQPLSVTLRASRARLTFGSMLTLTAHVVPSPAGEVRFYRIATGSNVKSLIGEGTVDGTGNRAITFQAGRIGDIRGRVARRHHASPRPLRSEIRPVASMLG